MHHHELLSKIWKIGIIGNLWKWFREYLNNGVQHVSISSSNSSIYCLSSLEFPREAFSGLFYSYYSSMTFLSMYCTPYHYCSQMTPNVCPPYHLLLTVNFYNLTLISSPTGVLSGSCSSTSPNAHCCPSVQTIIAVPTSFPTTSTIAKSFHVLITRILASLAMSYDLSWSKHIAQISSKAYRILGLLLRTLSATNSTARRKSLYIPWSAHNCSTVLRFGDLS